MDDFVNISQSPRAATGGGAAARGGAVAEPASAPKLSGRVVQLASHRRVRVALFVEDGEPPREMECRESQLSHWTAARPTGEVLVVFSDGLEGLTAAESFANLRK